MSAARTSISMPDDLMADAVARQRALRLSSFSDYIQDLIRRDLTDHGITLHDAPITPPSAHPLASAAQAVPVSYHKTRATHRTRTPKQFPKG